MLFTTVLVGVGTCRGGAGNITPRPNFIAESIHAASACLFRNWWWLEFKQQLY